MSEQEQLLLELADDELILGWRDSEWTGIAPFLEEDVAFSSIAQNEIGHARALYELAARELGTTRTRSRSTARRRSTAARRSSSCGSCPTGRGRSRGTWLYEAADELRLEALKASDDAEVAGLAAKIDREEAYHRMHAQMWADRLRGRAALRAAVEELWPYALGVLDAELRPRSRSASGSRRSRRSSAARTPTSWPALWEEMTMVRRSVPGATW